MSFDISVFPEDEDGGCYRCAGAVARCVEAAAIYCCEPGEHTLQPQLSIPAAPHLSQHLHTEVSSVLT